MRLGFTFVLERIVHVVLVRQKLVFPSATQASGVLALLRRSPGCPWFIAVCE